MATYVAERQVEYWTSNAITTFFDSLDFRCLTFPIQQRAERSIPVDHVFSVSGLVKVFGLQYKVLYQGAPDYWSLDQQQHRDMKSYDAMYYALSLLTAATEGHQALHALRLTHPDFRYREKLYDGDGWWPKGAARMSWWEFYVGLKACHTGALAEEPRAILRLFAPGLDSLVGAEEVRRMTDYFAVNLEGRRLLRLTTLPQ